MNMQTHHRQRISQQYTDGDNTIEKVWAGVCEYITKNGQQYKHTYLTGPMGVFAIHIINPNGTEEINYIHTDHLGSWNTITDKDGNLLQELSFDAWGNRRNPATWRAFTGTAPNLYLTEVLPGTFGSRLVCYFQQTNYGCQSRRGTIAGSICMPLT